MELDEIRHNWTQEELRFLVESPLLELVWKAQQVHQLYQRSWEIQVCEVISVKTGGCPENCSYCGQCPITKRVFRLNLDEAKKSRESSKFDCQWNHPDLFKRCLAGSSRGKAFRSMLEMIQELTALGVEVCCTLGMLQPEHAQRLAEAGLYSYNHNLDTSESFYSTIITSHTYQDRINTLNNVQKAGFGVCCGGIVGLGETLEDRLELIRSLANRNPHPDSGPPEPACANSRNSFRKQ